jgi:ATP-binding cassette, subfamily B (MDR/TAP), member 1
VPLIPTHGGIFPPLSDNDTSSGSVKFEHVDFSYPCRPDLSVLKNFTLEIKSNTTVALVGASGSGKSTVLCLLERFYDVSAGRIMIDGVDIRQLDPVYLHRILAIVPQEPVLFSGSIKSNIL